MLSAVRFYKCIFRRCSIRLASCLPMLLRVKRLRRGFLPGKGFLLNRNMVSRCVRAFRFHPMRQRISRCLGLLFQSCSARYRCKHSLDTEICSLHRGFVFRGLNSRFLVQEAFFLCCLTKQHRRLTLRHVTTLSALRVSPRFLQSFHHHLGIAFCKTSFKSCSSAMSARFL